MPIEYITIAEGIQACIPNLSMSDVKLNQEVWGKLAQASRALAELNGATSMLTMPGMGVLTYPMLAREAETSSRIEGTRSTLEEVLQDEMHRSTTKGEAPGADLQEVQNYLASAQLGFRLLEDFPLCWRVIRQLHRQLLDGVRGRSCAPGEFRRIQVWIGGRTMKEAVYIPPPPDYLPKLTSLLEAYLNAENGLDPLLKCGIAHAQFELIHPFMDGNGRVGRLLISLFLRQTGLLNQPVLVLSEYFEHNRSAYYEALNSVVSEESWEKWLNYFLTAVHAQAETRLRLTNAQVALYWAYKSRIRELAGSKRGVKPVYLEPALDVLFKHVYINSAMIKRSLNVENATASRIIQGLHNLGAIVETSGRSRNREYCCDELLKLLRG